MATTRAISDPAYPLLNGSLARDARTISACLKATYTGTLVNASGEYCILENYPAESLLNSAGSAGQSVNGVFRNATNSGMLSRGSHEIKFRGDVSSNDVFHDKNGPSDRILQVGIPAANASTFSDSALSVGPRAIVFAWRGYDTSTFDFKMTFNLVKNVEWRPQIDSGLVESIPRAVGDGDSKHKHVLAHLDQHFPGWATTAIHSVQGFGRRVGRAGLNAGLAYAGKQGLKYLERQAIGALPLLAMM
jgi:hypothetical protein